MRDQAKLYLRTILTLVSFQAFSANNPISWQLDHSYPTPILQGDSQVLTYTFTNQLPFQLKKPLVIQSSVSPANEFTFVDTCTGQRLNAKSSCTVIVRLDPILIGAKTLQLTMSGYDNNQVTLPAVSTIAVKSESQSLVQGSVITSLPETLQLGSSANYTFKFSNTITSQATSVTIQSNQSENPSFTTTCASSLDAGESCTVSGSYTAQSATPSTQSVTATLSYSEGSPVTVSTGTTVTSVTGVIGSLVSPNYLPATMVGGASNSKTLQFLFTNYNSTAVTITSDSVVITGGTGATFTSTSDSCSGSPSLPSGAACQIEGTFVAPTETTPTAFTVTATVFYAGGSTPLSTSTTVVHSISTNRVITFNNHCSFDVWFSLNGGALAASPNCPDTPCPEGTVCNETTHLCYWQNYDPDNDTHQLAPNGSNTITIPLTLADPNVQWSGTISASTLCNGTTCGQADCGNQGGTTSCATGQGFLPPATQAEITMNISSADDYDVETINGFHIPIQFAPGPYVTANNYSCGTPGSYTATNGFGACNWETAAVPQDTYFWVETSSTTCGSGLPACTTGLQCGLDNNLDQVCGAFLGYWTANQACAQNATKANTYFNCNQALGTPFPSDQYTLKQLMACSVPTGDTSPRFNSCYGSYPNYSALSISQCCGCVDWWTLGIGANSSAQSCTPAGKSTPQTDPQWTGNVQSTIQWMKTACPSVYTYQFDDATSLFNCTNNLPNSSNSVGYTVTFCEGNSGLPAGITDGR